MNFKSSDKGDIYMWIIRDKRRYRKLHGLADIRNISVGTRDFIKAASKFYHDLVLGSLAGRGESQGMSGYHCLFFCIV